MSVAHFPFLSPCVGLFVFFYDLCPKLFGQTKCNKMSEEIKNEGTKGYVILGIFLFLLLFVLLVVYIYQRNFLFLPS
jgi:hypothetical protein